MESFPANEVAILGDSAHALAAALNTHYIPNRILLATAEPFEEYPLFSGRFPKNDTLIYVCQNFACRLPVKTVKEALELVNDLNG